MRADDYLDTLNISRIWRRFGYHEPKDISKITDLPTVGVYGKRFSIRKQKLILYSLFLNRVINHFKLQLYFTDFFNTHIHSLSRYVTIKEVLIHFILEYKRRRCRYMK